MLKKFILVAAFTLMLGVPAVSAATDLTMAPMGVTKPASWYKEAWLWWKRDFAAMSYNVYVYDKKVIDSAGNWVWSPVSSQLGVSGWYPTTNVRYLEPNKAYKWRVATVYADGTEVWGPYWDLRPMNKNGVRVTWMAQKSY